MAQAPKSSTVPSQEGLLLDYVRRLEKHRRGRRAVHIHLSRLRPFNRREHHVRAAANNFESLVKQLQGQLFTLKNSDFIFIFKEEAFDGVQGAIQKIRFLFGDDPLLAESLDDDDQAQLCTWYNVDGQYNQVLDLARDLFQKIQDEEQAKRDAEAQERKAALGEPLTPRILARVEDALLRADLTNLVRRQYVCAIAAGGVPHELFSELFISIKDLRETLLPGVNLSSSRWLFQHLTEVLDYRILSMLGKTGERLITGEISINLNVATLLSPQFLQFDDNVIASMRGGIIIELQKIDIFADLGAFLFAREFIKGRGYRLLIDGLTPQTLPFIDRERLGADFVKLIWTPDILDQGPAALDGLRAQLRTVGEDKVILSRCDTKDAIAFGQSLGVGLFQGRQIETLIAEENRKRAMRLNKKRR